MATPTVIPTDNPIPSQAIPDLLYNVELLDALVNGTDDYATSRLGVSLETWHHIKERISTDAVSLFAQIGASPLAPVNWMFGASVADGYQLYFFDNGDEAETGYYFKPGGGGTLPASPVGDSEWRVYALGAADYLPVQSSSAQVTKTLGEWIDFSVGQCRTPQNAMHAFATSRSASSRVSDAWAETKLGSGGVISSVAGYNYGWGADYTGAESIELDMPFGVVIGDSISEGRPTYNGRLTAGGTKYNYDPSLESGPGQPSYEMIRRTGAYWYNHGIYGDQTGDVVGRWRRDVLGETFDPGDGIGDQTLPVGRKPYAVWVNVGINDGYAGETSTQWQKMKDNYRYMAQSAIDNGIIIIFNTIGPNGKEGDLSNEKQIRANEYLKTEIKAMGAYIFDYSEFFKQPGSINTIEGSRAVDNIHPSPAGHIAMAGAMLRETGAPIVLQSLAIESLADPEHVPPSFVQIDAVRLDYPNGNSTGAELNDGIGFARPKGSLYSHDDTLRLVVTRAGGIAPASGKWAGLSSVRSVFGVAREEVAASSELFYATLERYADAWRLMPVRSSHGVVGPEDEGNGNLYIRLEGLFGFVTAAMIGNSGQYVATASVSGAFPADRAVVRFRDASGTQVADTELPNGTQVAVMAVAY